MVAAAATAVVLPTAVRPADGGRRREGRAAIVDLRGTAAAAATAESALVTRDGADDVATAARSLSCF